VDVAVEEESSLKNTVRCLNNKLVTIAFWLIIRKHCLLNVSHTRMLMSSDPDANVKSSNEIDKQFIFCLIYDNIKTLDISFLFDENWSLYLLVSNKHLAVRALVRDQLVCFVKLEIKHTSSQQRDNKKTLKKKTQTQRTIDLTGMANIIPLTRPTYKFDSKLSNKHRLGMD